MLVNTEAWTWVWVVGKLPRYDIALRAHHDLASFPCFVVAMVVTGCLIMVVFLEAVA